MKEQVLVIGGKGMQVLPAEALIAAERLGGHQHFAGFLLDDTSQAERLAPLGPIVGGLNDAKHFAEKGFKILFALWHTGEVARRIKLFESLGLPDEALATVISPYSTVSALATLGPGTFVAPHAHVGADTVIGRCNFINVQCNIEHNSTLGDYNIFAAQAMVHSVSMGHGNFVGIQSLIDAPVGNGNYIGFCQVIRKRLGDNQLVTTKFPKTECFPVEMIDVLNRGVRK